MPPTALAASSTARGSVDRQMPSPRRRAAMLAGRSPRCTCMQASMEMVIL